MKVISILAPAVLFLQLNYKAQMRKEWLEINLLSASYVYWEFYVLALLPLAEGKRHVQRKITRI